MVLSCLPFMGIEGRNLSSHVLSILGFKHRKTQFDRPAWTIPLNPGPFRYPVAVIKQTTPSVELGMLSKTFHIAQRQKQTYRFFSTYSYLPLPSLRKSSSGVWLLLVLPFSTQPPRPSD